ncbi:hypothetical protein [Enterobacter cloacae]|uniref:hypothetical protein n=1 Tax=Enterobacter cloacae TaxID=550 RepID=UPI003D24EC3C
MNYPGLETLRADVAALSNAMCDVRMLLNRLESQHRHDAATLTERMAAQTLRRINTCFWKPGAKPWCWTKPFRTD